MGHRGGGFPFWNVVSEIRTCRVQSRAEIRADIATKATLLGIPPVPMGMVAVSGGGGGQGCDGRIVYNVIVVMIVVIYNYV